MLDWRSLPPGRDLDRLIATRLGLQVVEGTAVFWNREGLREYTNVYVQVHGTAHPLPEYSTDVNAAVSVFNQEFPLDWSVFSDNSDDVTCDVGHWDIDGEGKDQVWEEGWKDFSLHIMVCMAICRAFLSYTDSQDHPPVTAYDSKWPGRETVSVNSAKLAEIARLEKQVARLQKENEDLRLVVMGMREAADVPTIRPNPEVNALIVAFLNAADKHAELYTPDASTKYSQGAWATAERIASEDYNLAAAKLASYTANALQTGAKKEGS